MASTTLYPPIVDSITPAFVAYGSASYCRLYFSLSKHSSSSLSQIKSIHISVIKQNTGQNVVNKTDNASIGRYRATGIIIVNRGPSIADRDRNLYYVDILNEDIQSGDQIGWYPGWIYKIQIRFSEIPYSSSIGQAVWLNQNASYFSEWSTYSTTKAIGKPRIVIPILDFDSDKGQSSNITQEYSLTLTTLDFNGTYSNIDESELLYSYRLKLYDVEDNLLEDSDTLYSDQYYNPNQFHYLFKTEFKDSTDYKIVLEYITINKYEESYEFDLSISNVIMKETNCSIITIETIDNVADEDYIQDFKSKTSLDFEQEEGLIALKLYSDELGISNKNLCIRRASSKDNFQTWEDIKIIICIDQTINSLPMYYDKIAESGVWYKYGVQEIESTGERTRLEEIIKPIIREWEFSYLVGEGGRQLKLKYNNVMNSYLYNKADSKTDTLGGKYPFISRNGNLEYRTFPVNGLISFNMDENELFTSDLGLYEYEDIVDLYRTRRKANYIFEYDYKREFDFREEVLRFLQDGKPKLFKSSTEGNIVVRLMQVSAQPNQSLNRMIFSFTSTAHEIAAPTLENYAKYGFFEVGEYTTTFVTYTSHIGQLHLDCEFGDDIIEKIWQKYDNSTKNIAGLTISLLKVHHLKITFTDKPVKVYNNAGQLIMGNAFLYNGTRIAVMANRSRQYLFDENIDFVRTDKIVIANSAEDIYDEQGNINNKVHVEVDFIYELTREPYKEKVVKNKITEKGIGQIYSTYVPDASIYRDVYYKYYYKWDNQVRKLEEIDWTCIEANPGTIFYIKDGQDSGLTPETSKYHEINQTGVLNLEGLGSIEDIRYIGVRKPDGSIDKETNADVIVDYLYYTTTRVYDEEA